MNKNQFNRIDYKTNEIEIRNSFIDLLGSMPIQKISIQQLTKNANVSRGTFYLHYEDIYQLLELIEDDLIDELIAINKDLYQFPLINFDISSTKTIPYFQETYEWINRNKKYIQVLFGANGSPTFEKKWRRCIHDIFIKKVQHDCLDVVDIDMFCTAISSAWIGVIENWINFRDDINTEKLSIMIVQMTKSILIGFSERKDIL